MRLLSILFGLVVGSLGVANAGDRVIFEVASSVTGELPGLSPGSQQTTCVLGDFSGNGVQEIVVTNRSTAPSVLLYIRSGNAWDRYVIEPGLLAIEAGGTSHDIDGDGDLDLVLGQDFTGDQVWWWENPGAALDPNTAWVRRQIKADGPSQHHDQTFGDFDGDGAIEFATMVNQSDQVRIYEIPADPLVTSPWPTFTTVNVPSSGFVEGMDAADVNQDGQTDLLAGGHWIQHQGGTSYTPVPIDASYTSSRLQACDLIPGGYLEVVLSSGDGDGPLNLYTFDGSSWQSTTLLPLVIHGHTLEVGDIDLDGFLDIFVAEMGDPGAQENATSWIGWGDGAGGFTFEVITVGVGNHMSRLGDVDGDQRLDLVMKPFQLDSPRLEVHLNFRPKILPLDQWNFHLIDALIPWKFLFITTADIDGDGREDIISGGHWYRNPGTPDGAWLRSAIGSPLHNMLDVRDFDGDGDIDIVGTDGQQSGDTFVYARNDGLGSFTVTAVTSAGVGNTFVQGVATSDLLPGGGLEIATSWQNGEVGQNGIVRLQVPTDPDQGIWMVDELHPSSQGEQITLLDIDADGDLDLFQGTQWLRNDGGDTWMPSTVSTVTSLGSPDRHAFGDLDADGDLDAVVGFDHFDGPTTELVWFERGVDPNQLWNMNTIDPAVGGGWSLDVADFDEDGDPDVVLGEHVPPTRLIIYENDGTGSVWVPHVIHPGGPGIDHHDGTLAIDIDSDGDLDIVSLAWDNEQVYLFENRSIVRLGSSDSEPPASPVGLVATALSDSEVLLDWDDNSEPDLDEYQVYRGATADFVPGGANRIAEDLKESTFRDEQLEETTEYFYKVRAGDTSGNLSTASDSASATTLIDVTPPDLAEVVALGPVTVRLRFTEPVDPTTAEATSNYLISSSIESISILTAALGADGRTVTLGTSAHSQTGLYTVSVLGVLDLAQPPLPADTSATYLSGADLLGLWLLDEGQGDIAFDSSGNGRDATLLGPDWTTQTANSAPHALEFDGLAGDTVDLNFLDIGGAEATIALWFQVQVFRVQDARLISKATGTATNDHYWMLGHVLSGQDYRVRCRFKTSADTYTLAASSGDVLADTWHHVAAVYDGSEIRLYLDGVEVGSLPAAGTLSSDPSVAAVIGNQPPGAGDRAFDGLIDDVRIYSVALSPAEIQQLTGETVSEPPPPPPPPAGLQAHYTFDEGAGSVATDATGNGNTGTIVGPTYQPTSGDNSPFYLRFDGVNDYVDLGTFDLGGDTASIAAWIRPDGFGVDDARIVSKATGTSTDDHFWMLGTVLQDGEVRLRARLRTGNNTNTVVADSDPFVLGAWTHVALVYDGTTVRLFKDGVQVGSDNQTGTLATSASVAAVIGNQPPGAGNKAFDGCIDDVRLYTSALSVAEIQALASGIPQNQPPVAVDDLYSVEANTTLTIDALTGVLDNDVDPEGDALTAQLLAGPSNGALTFNTDGSFVYTPNLDFSGATDSFTYQALDATGISNVATVSIDVSSIPGVPTAVADSYSTDEEVTLVVDALNGVLANDLDPELDPLQAVLVGSVSHGTLTLELDGAFSYTPDVGFAGVDFFTYVADDGTVSSSPATVMITVNLISPPVAVDDSYATNADTPLVVPASGVLSNDSDPQGDMLTTVLVADVSNGTLGLSADGGFSYTPDLGFVGTDMFQYAATDGTKTSNTATVSISVTPFLSQGLSAYYSFDEGSGITAQDGSGNGNDGAINGAQYVMTTPDLSASALRFDGDDDLVELGALDLGGTEITITMWFKAETFGIADARLISRAKSTAAGNHYWMLSTVFSNGDTRLRARLMTQGDTETLIGNGAALSTDMWIHAALVYDGTTLRLYQDAVEIGSIPQTGTIDTSPTVLAAIGNQPPGAGNKAFDGCIDEVRIYSRALTLTEIQSLASFVPPNAAPVAVDDTYTMDANSTLTTTSLLGVLANDSDAEGDPLTANLSTAPSNGTLVLNADGSFVYTPVLNFGGASDSFTYVVDDGNGTSNEATVMIQVNAVAGVPIATPDMYTVDEGLTLDVDSLGGVLANDMDPDMDPLVALLGDDVSNGTLTLQGDGSFQYVPAPGFSGVDSFTYQADDGNLPSSPATVTITVNFIAPPVATDDTYAIEVDEVLVVDAGFGVLANDNDPQGDSLTVQLVSDVSNGTLSLAADGSFTYSPAVGFAGTDEFTYEATDGSKVSNVAVATISVSPPMGAGLKAHYRFEEGSGTIALDSSGNANDAVIAGPNHVLDSPRGGQYVLNFDGSGDYVDLGALDVPGTELTLALWFNAASFDIADARLISKAVGTAGGSHYWMISTVVSNGQTLLRGRLMTGGDTETLIASTGELSTGVWVHVALVYDGSTLRLYKDGVEVGVRSQAGAIDTSAAVPAAIGNQPPGAGNKSFDGAIDEVRIYCRALDAAEIQALVGAAPNDPPVADNDFAAVQTGGSTVIDVLDGDTDDGTLDPATVQIVDNPQFGSVSVNPVTGAVTYSHFGGPEMADSFTYQVQDNLGVLSNVAVVTLQISAPNDSVAQWEFDEGSGFTAIDSTGNGNDGALLGTTWSTDTPDGSSSSMNFSGADDELVDIGNLDVTGSALTMAMWIRADDFDEQDARLISKARGTAANAHYWMISTLDVGGEFRLRVRLRTNGTTDTLVASSGALTAGSWIHVAAVYDGATLRIYKDGVEVGSMAKTGNLDTDPTVGAAIGNQPLGAGDKGFDGRIDSVQIFSRALSPGEINTLAGN